VSIILCFLFLRQLRSYDTNPSLSQGNELTAIYICLYAAADVTVTPTERLNSKRMYIVQSDDSDSVYQILFVAHSVH